MPDEPEPKPWYLTGALPNVTPPVRSDEVAPQLRRAADPAPAAPADDHSWEGAPIAGHPAVGSARVGVAPAASKTLTSRDGFASLTPPAPTPAATRSSDVVDAAAPKRLRIVQIVLAAVVVALLGGVGVGVALASSLGPSRALAAAPGATQTPSSDAPASDSVTRSESSQPTQTSDPTETPAPTPTLDEAGAVAQLDELAAEGASQHALDGRWVDQVASKYVGIRDPLQTTATGSHVFTAVDILAESDRLRALAVPPDEGFVLNSTLLGSKWVAPTGAPYWITFVDGAFASKSDAQQWCASAFAGLDASQVKNACLPRRLSPVDE